MHTIFQHASGVRIQASEDDEQFVVADSVVLTIECANKLFRITYLTKERKAFLQTSSNLTRIGQIQDLNLFKTD